MHDTLGNNFSKNHRKIMHKKCSCYIVTLLSLRIQLLFNSTTKEVGIDATC